MATAAIVIQYRLRKGRYDSAIAWYPHMIGHALDHRLLRQFLAIADAGSVRGGAAALNVSQPPLSQAIKRLEDDLGLVLFERLPKGMALTEAGRVLADEARVLLSRLDRAEARVRRSAEGDPVLRIGFVSAALNGALQKLLSDNRDRRIELTEMTTPEQVGALTAGRIDVALLHPPIDADDVPVRSLGRDPFVAALPNDHPLAERDAITFEEIASEPFVLFPSAQGPSLFSAIERLAFEAGQELRVATTASRVHSQLAIVAGGLGVGLVTRSTADVLAFKGVRFVPITDTTDRLFMELAIAGERG